MFALPLYPDCILLEDGQVLVAPPEVEPAPESGATPACACLTDAVSLAEQIAAIDAADFYQLLVEADQMERENLRAQIALWQCQEADGWHCGMSIDFRAEIESARAQIAVLDERLFCFDLCAELCA